MKIIAFVLILCFAFVSLGYAETLKVTRYELSPKENPTHYDVGFEVRASNGRLFYTSTKVLIDTKKSDEEILQLAYDNLKAQIEPKVAELEGKSPLLRKDFIVENGKLKKNELTIE